MGLYNDHFHTRQTNTKNTGSQLLHGLQLGNRTAVGHCPKAK